MSETVTETANDLPPENKTPKPCTGEAKITENSKVKEMDENKKTNEQPKIMINPEESPKTPKKPSNIVSTPDTRRSGRKRVATKKVREMELISPIKSPVKRKGCHSTPKFPKLKYLKTPVYKTPKNLKGVTVYRTGRDDEICIPSQTFGFLGFTSQLWKTALTMKDNQHKVLFNIRPKHVTISSAQEKNRYRMLDRSGVQIEKGSQITIKSDIIFIDYNKEDAYEFLSNVVDRLKETKMIINMAIGLSERQLSDLAKKARDRGLKWMNLSFLGTTDSIWKMDSMAFCDGDKILFDACLMSLKCLTDSIYYFEKEGEAFKYKLTVDSVRAVHAMSVCDNELIGRKLDISNENLLKGYKDVGFDCELHRQSVNISYEQNPENMPVITCEEIQSSMTEYNSLKMTGKHNKLPAFYDRKISQTLEKTLNNNEDIKRLQAVALYQYEVESQDESA